MCPRLTEGSRFWYVALPTQGLSRPTGKPSVLPFSKLINYFLETLIQKTYFEIMKINNFRGDLTDISAKKEALETILFALVTGKLCCYKALPLCCSVYRANSAIEGGFADMTAG